MLLMVNVVEIGRRTRLVKTWQAMLIESSDALPSALRKRSLSVAMGTVRHLEISDHRFFKQAHCPTLCAGGNCP